MRIKNFHKAKTIFFALVFLSFFPAGLALAQNYVPLVPIPGVAGGTGLLGYLSGLYDFLISVVGILAMAVIIYGGLRYLTSVGNPSAVESAKETIMSAIYGLILALVSWVILSTINPDTLVLKKPGVAGPGNTYSTATSANSCLSAIGRKGTLASPCKCLDGAEVVAATAGGSTPTILTLSVSPNPATTTPPSNNVTATGKLTDSSGTSLSGQTVKINTINFTLNANNASSFTTNAAGDFTFNYTATCATGVADVEMQAVYAGNATYAAVGSTPVKIVVNGLTVCTTGNYTFSPANVGLFAAGDCQNVCSDVSKQNIALLNGGFYHCVGPKIAVSGLTVKMNSDGVSATMKVNGDIIIDGVTNSLFPDSTTKSGAQYEWHISGPGPAVNYAMAAATPSILKFTTTVPGYPFTVVGTYEIDWRIGVPPTAPGVPPVLPAGINGDPFWIVVVP